MTYAGDELYDDDATSWPVDDEGNWIWEDDGGGWDSYDYGPAIVSIEPKGDVL